MLSKLNENENNLFGKGESNINEKTTEIKEKNFHVIPTPINNPQKLSIKDQKNVSFLSTRKQLRNK